MKSIIRFAILPVLLAAFIPGAALAKNGNSRTIYGGFGARGYGAGGYTYSGDSADTEYGSGYYVPGDSAFSVPGSAVSYELARQPIMMPAAMPADAGSDYYVTGGTIYK